MLPWTALLLLLLLLPVPVPVLGRHYPHSAVLDGASHYRLWWAHLGGSIAFRLEVRTRGYVGFGLSPTGAMASSDLVLGGVDGGKPYLQDYFTMADRTLKKDSQQDYHLEHAMENDTHTILAFTRKLHTCDSNDRTITESTVKVIWSYHDKDFQEGGQNYHHLNRGTKSLRLLNPEKTAIISSSLPYFDFISQDVLIPDKDTTYWCEIFKVPELNEKHHVIKVEPLIQKGHESLVHHILLYQCGSNVNDSVLGNSHECYSSSMPDASCQAIIFAWAIGGESFTYPPHVGLSIGTAEDPQYVLMEVHYDNPSYVEGVRDNSGLRLFYTSDLRQYDAGVIETGIWISLFHNIPPGIPEFTSEGHCTQQCLEEVLEAENPSGIHVFAVLLHAHLAGRAIRVRHLRKGHEQPLLSYDDNFDFNFQAFEHLKEERTILPGDHLITECRYSTLNRSHVTWGGFTSTDEMCLSYLMYYPRINLNRCESIPDILDQIPFIGVKQIYEPVTAWPFTIKSPKLYRNLSFLEAMNKFKWTKEKGLSFSDFILKLKVTIRCAKYNNTGWKVHGDVATPPEIKRPYVVRPVICPRTSSSCCLNCNLFLTLMIALYISTTAPRNSVCFV